MEILLFQTHIGWMAGACSAAGLKALALPQVSRQAALNTLAGELRASVSRLPEPVTPQGILKTLMEEVDLYFKGERVEFTIQVDWSGYTPFQRRVLNVVRSIPYGETASYGQVALESGSPLGARAVGGVMRSNRTPLVIPCHRVVAAGGALGGFRGGLDLKIFLLRLENRYACKKDITEILK